MRVSELSEDVRRIAYALHPAALDDLGLVAAMQSFFRDMEGREGLKIRFSHSGVPGALPAEIGTTVYRVMQEAVRNVIKHARTQSAAVSLTERAGRLVLCVKDAGAGFDLNDHPRGLGLVAFEERARLIGARLMLRSEPGKGTSVELSIPLDPNVAGGA
jgi:two-component system sensor histidine kinase NreB